MVVARRSSPSCALAWSFAIALGALAACGGQNESDVFVPVTPTPPTLCLAQIGSVVWCDTDCDGVRDPGEPGLPGVTVTISDDAGAPLDQVVTDAAGGYGFAATLPCPVALVVAVDEATVPAGFTPSPSLVGVDPSADSNGSPAVVLIEPGNEAQLSVDFGFCPPPDLAAIGDFVWHDLNGDGIQQGGEPGLDNVRVILRDEAGVFVADTTTGPGAMGQNGQFRFTGYPEGTYSVEVDMTTLPANFAATLCEQGSDPAIDSNCLPAIVDLAHVQDEATVDFGFVTVPTGEIGDFVWQDLDADGIQDAEELDDGINGVTVWLKDAAGNLLQTTTTQSAPDPGAYRFTGLAAGTYVVEIDESTLPQLAGLVPAPCGVGSDPSVDNNCSPAMVVLPTDDTIDDTVDFGYQCPFDAQVGDFVWDDVNRDGIQDAGEPGLQGVRVLLKDDAGVQLAETSTGSAGEYRFTQLAAASYVVEIDSSTLPPNYVPSPCQVGSDPAVDNDCSPAMVTLTPSQIDETVDFGFHSDASGQIGDFVWQDDDCDGLQDPGEPGLAGVTVLLKSDAGVLLAQQSTGADGSYTFGGLPAGGYIVDVDLSTVPAGYVASPCGVGADPTIDSNCAPARVFLLSSTSSVDDVDFGFYPPTAYWIGDRVWFDADGNGLQDPGESGLEGVEIVLTDASGALLQRQKTDEDGSYRFDCLASGTYFIEVNNSTVPATLVPVPCNVGTDPTIDSNCVPARVVLTATSSNDETIDFGFTLP